MEVRYTNFNKIRKDIEIMSLKHPNEMIFSWQDAKRLLIRLRFSHISDIWCIHVQSIKRSIKKSFYYICY